MISRPCRLLIILILVAKGQAIISGVAINTPTLVRIRKRLTSDVRGRSKDAPALWAAQRNYEEKHGKAEVRDYMGYFQKQYIEGSYIVRGCDWEIHARIDDKG